MQGFIVNENLYFISNKYFKYTPFVFKQYEHVKKQIMHDNYCQIMAHEIDDETFFIKFQNNYENVNDNSNLI